MQVKNKHDKGTQTAQLAPHASCSLAQIIVNNYAQSGFLHNLNHMYIQARAIRRVVIGPA